MAVEFNETIQSVSMYPCKKENPNTQPKRSKANDQMSDWMSDSSFSKYNYKNLIRNIDNDFRIDAAITHGYIHFYDINIDGSAIINGFLNFISYRLFGNCETNKIKRYYIG